MRPYRSLPALGFALAMALAASPSRAEPLSRAEAELTLDVLERRMQHYALGSATPSIIAALRRERAALINLNDAERFRSAVNALLLQTSGDKHLSLWPTPPIDPTTTPVSPEEMEAAGNYGVEIVRRLPGNVGYLKLTHFSGSPMAVEAIDDAMALLSRTDALIIDVRWNGGGGPVAGSRLMGHLFRDRVELGGILWRRCAPPPPTEPDLCEQIEPELERRWADAPAAPRYVDRPVYVLTSAETFSAAEALAYDLKQEGRAVLVGQTTKGGGNPGGLMDAGPRFSVIMPTGVGVHPRTGTSFEGGGVAPDVEAAPDVALDVAHRLALEAVNNPVTAVERQRTLDERTTEPANAG